MTEKEREEGRKKEEERYRREREREREKRDGAEQMEMSSSSPSRSRRRSVAAVAAMAGGGWRNLLLPQLNRQSLYVYGSEIAVEEECIKQRDSGILVIHPFSPIRYQLSACFALILYKVVSLYWHEREAQTSGHSLC